MKLVDEKSNTYINSSQKIMMKILNLKLVILLEYQNIKTFLQKLIFQIGLRKFLLQKLKILLCGHMLLVILKVKELLVLFMKKNCQKQFKKSLEVKKSIKRKDYILN